MKRSLWGALVISAISGSCGQNPAFVERSIENYKNPPEEEATARGRGSGDASAVKSRNFSFGRNIKPLAADYLFVLDNSISMERYSQKVASGLAAIPASSFPQSSKVAVMTTMAASDPYADSLTTHQDIRRDDYTCIDQEPGFLEFIKKESLDRYKSCDFLQDDYLQKYAIEACDDPWFAPFAENRNGQRCFSAALQNAFSVVGCEPGLLALEQILERNKNNPLFRSDAVVNVIFISDEQAGCRTPETNGQNTSAQKLVEMIKSNSGSFSVTLHGIVPESAPEGVTKYSDVINASKGVMIPISQDRPDYRDVIQTIVEARVDLTSAVFDLGELATKILSVKVNDVMTEAFEFDGERRITIKDLDPSLPAVVSIEFY